MEKNSAVGSAETKNPDPHLLGSSDKTDFIVNMTHDGAQKLAGIYSIIAVIVVCLMTLPYYLAKQFGTPNKLLMLQTEQSIPTSMIIMPILIMTGLAGYFVFMIFCIKKEFNLAANKNVWLFAAILLSGLLSAVLSKDPMTCIFGYLERAEGMLTIFGYLGFFMLGICITGEKYRSAAVGAVIGAGTLNAVIGILQSIPALSAYIPSYYNYLYINSRQNVKVAEYFNVYAGYDASFAADGLTCSPFTLGAFMTLSAALAVNRAVYAEKTPKRIICLVCTGLMIGAAVVTQTIPALVGIGCVIVITLVFALTDKKTVGDGEKRVANKGAIISAVLAVVMSGAIAAGIVLTDNFRLRDEHIMFTDSLERLSIAPYAHTAHEDDIYSTLWYEGWLCFKDHAVVGVGSDCWMAMYAGGEGMETDRTYNEYLDLALTRGVIGLGLYVAVLAVTFAKAVRMLKAAREGAVNKGVAAGAFTALTAYAVQAFMNTTSHTVTPLFMLVVGIIWSYEAITGKPKKQNSLKPAQK